MTDYYLFNTKSPIQTNLEIFLQQRGWQPTEVLSRAKVADNLLDFPVEISETLEYKNLLANFCQQNGLSDMIPLTLCLDDDNWYKVIRSVNQREWGRFILKPALLNNGEHIFIFENLDSLLDHYIKGKRLGGPHVLQKYIDPPHLIQGPKYGHKYSIRQFLVLSTHAGFGLYPNGYLNIALKPYSGVDCDLAAHLTNEHLSCERINVVQRISSEMAVYQPFKEQIVLFCQKLSHAIWRSFSNLLQGEQARFACFGIDFMIDVKEKLWLLEVNHGPCFPVDFSHPLFEKLYTPFWKSVISKFIEGEPSSFIEL